MEDKNLLLALNLKQGGGGSGSGLPGVTAEDNGKVPSVVDGEWQVTNVPYTQTTVLFKGNAVVTEI